MSALLSSFAASLEVEHDQTLSTQSELSLTLRPSLWSHVSSLLQPAERDEARQLIASPLIADNAALEEEVRALLHIASSLHHSSPSASPTSSSAHSSPVPPLPSLFGLSQKERLKDEVSFLISALREKAAERGDGDVAKLWTPRSDRECAVASMVEKEKRLTSRSASGASPASYRSSTSGGSRPSSSVSVSSASAEGRAAVGASSRPASSGAAAVASLSSLSVFTMDRVVTRLRQALVDEREELLRDADFLRAYIEEEELSIAQANAAHGDHSFPPIPPPTENELRGLREQLEAAVEREEERERTMRRLNALPQKPAFQPKPSACSALSSTNASLAAGEAVSAESVDAMLASLDAMEASLYQPQPLFSPSDSAHTHTEAGRETRRAEVLTLEVEGEPTPRTPSSPSASALHCATPPSDSVFTIRRGSAVRPSSHIASPSARRTAGADSSAVKKAMRPSPFVPSIHG